MNRSTLAAVLVIAALPAGAQAQTHDAHSQHAGHETREIKALSAEDAAGYLAGEGMGLALAAELNRYPGPRHVLDLADMLALTAEQRAAVGDIFAAMRSEAVELGRRYVESESVLDQLFASRTVDPASLRRATQEIGVLLGALREVHLRAHLETTALLTSEQIDHYDRHRGYGDRGAHGEHGGHGGHEADVSHQSDAPADSATKGGRGRRGAVTGTG
jgi:Spy/CpxP family protein refolding chaperone